MTSFMGLFVVTFLLALGAAFVVWRSAGEQLGKLFAEGFRPGRPARREGSVLKDRSVSHIPALNQVLRPLPYVGALEKIIEQAGRRVRAATVLLASLTLAAGALFVTARVFQCSAVLTVAAVSAAGAAPFAYLFRVRQRRLRQFEERFPEALDFLARALRAGHALPGAMALAAGQMTGPVAEEFEKTVDEQNLGYPVRKALARFAERVPLEDVRFFAAAVALQHKTGGPLTEVLDTLARTVRARQTLRRHVRAVSAGGRLSGAVLWGLPVVLGLLLYLVNPEYISILFEEKAGRCLLWGSLVSQVLGFLFVRRIVRVNV